MEITQDFIDRSIIYYDSSISAFYKAYLQNFFKQVLLNYKSYYYEELSDENKMHLEAYYIEKCFYFDILYKDNVIEIYTESL